MTEKDLYVRDIWTGIGLPQHSRCLVISCSWGRDTCQGEPGTGQSQMAESDLDSYFFQEMMHHTILCQSKFSQAEAKGVTISMLLCQIGVPS